MLYSWNRPFRDVDEMNRHLLQEWSLRVREDATIICLGDVAHPNAWTDRRLMLDVRNCPGKRMLAIGNHDHDGRRLQEEGFKSRSFGYFAERGSASQSRRGISRAGASRQPGARSTGTRASRRAA